MLSRGPSVRRAIPTPPPFRLKPRRLGNGGLQYTHSGLQHAYLPLLVAAVTAILAVFILNAGLNTHSRRPSAPQFILLASGGLCGVVSAGSVILAWVAGSAGMRLRIDPARGEVAMERLNPLGMPRTPNVAPLSQAHLLLHDFNVRTPDPRSAAAALLAQFSGQVLVLHAPGLAFALAALREEAKMNAYVQSLPPPLDALPIDLGPPVSGVGGVAIF